jgi:hypothetical protein
MDRLGGVDVIRHCCYLTSSSLFIIFVGDDGYYCEIAGMLM